MQQIKKITHSLYSGLGGHTSVFWAMEKYAKDCGYIFSAALYGIEEPLESTIDRLEENLVNFDVIKKNGKFDILHTFRLALAIKRTHPDIIFLHGSYGILIIYIICCIFNPTKLVVRETQALNLKTKREKINAFISLLLSDKLIFLTDQYQKDFLNSSIRLRYQQKTKVIANGLDLNFYTPIVTRNIKDDILIGMQSRLVSIKDHKTLISAVKILIERGHKNLQLFIAGDGPTFKELENIICHLGLQENIHLLGLIEAKHIPRFLNTLDIYVHSSYGETMSNSIMQAQSCGLPIVATNVFGINNVITDKENGFLFELGNVNSLVNILELLKLDDQLRNSFSLISREYAVKHLSDQVMAYKYYEIFDEVIRRK